MTSFPLERPATHRRRRESGDSGSLPYFISGEENRLVRLVAEATTPVFEYGNPLLLIGPIGCGKTVIANHVAAKQALATPIDARPAKVNYYTAVDFARFYAEAVAADDLLSLRTEMDQASVIVIDDLHLIAEKPPAQEELAMRIENRTLAGRPIIVTCRRLPSEVRGIRPLLSSRVLPGLTIPIAMPSGSTRLAILRELALSMDLEIDGNLIEILNDGFDSQLPVRSLQAGLKQISLWCRMNDSPPTLDAIQSAIDLVGGGDETPLSKIAMTVGKHFGFRLSELRSSSRKQNLVRARSLAMYLSRQLTSKSLHLIGEYYGGRDHTTVLHAVRKTESKLQESAELQRGTDEILERLSIG